MNEEDPAWLRDELHHEAEKMVSRCAEKGPSKDNEKEARIRDLMGAISNLFKQVDVSETEALEALDKARKEIYDDPDAGRFS